MRFKSHLLICIFFLVGFAILVGCSSKPSDVSQDIWDDGIQLTIFIDQIAKGIESHPKELVNVITKFADVENVSKHSEKEMLIIESILTLSVESIDSQLSGKLTPKYIDTYTELEKIFGKSNLSVGNFNKQSILDKIALASEDSNLNKPTIIEQYKKNNDISLTAKDVQFDIVNNLGKDFVIEGTASLSNYYNYGFDDSLEGKYFCISVVPSEGKISDRWYLYLNRDSFKEFFELLKKEDQYFIGTATIPDKVYKEGQGLMAFVKKVNYQK